jgi:peptidoglycan/xylan/chitin deacetylase (PgdA/CDA1 family)
MKKHAHRVFARISRFFGILLILAVMVWPIAMSASWFINVSNIESLSEPKGALTVNPMNIRSIDVDPASIKPFHEPIITVTFDDGWVSIYDNGLPIFQKFGVTTTQYVLTSTFDDPNYFSEEQVVAIHNAGHEIASHTVTHRDLTKLDAQELVHEITDSKRALSSIIGRQVEHFAVPYGAYNTGVIREIQKEYTTHRNTYANIDEIGLEDINTAENFDRYQIIALTIRKHTSIQDLERIIEFAKKHNGWLVLNYHQVDYSGNEYSVTPEQLIEQMQMISLQPLRIATIGQVTASIQNQR